MEIARFIFSTKKYEYCSSNIFARLEISTVVSSLPERVVALR